ncbi:hypothetical protein C0995_011353 [Termitomyces sp. Mi166|nr:hypothetical protein C0995_011353 [Termitomyces sp. Mi166\
MVIYPECQVRAQKEMDAVIGTDRLPEFEDREKLPYLECMPHRALEDDVYRGMFIPKNATIVTNIRAMTLDDSVYKDATKFDPTRFLPAPEGRNEPLTTALYGFGHRKCPGRFLADDNIWIAIATVLATVSISPAIGQDGKEIIPEAIVVASGIASHAKPFTCRIEPREASKVLAQYIDSVQ